MSTRDTAPKYQPPTFRERGVCVPLTTPMLCGARVRPTDRDGLELVVPKASGGRGNYVVPWRNIPDLCQPGVHDTRLVDRIGTLRTITPATVREAAWQTAIEGFAGRRARAAATLAAAAEQEARLLTNSHLMLSLVRQLDPASLGPGPFRASQIEPLAKRALARMAAQMGRDGEAMMGALEKLAALLAPVGLGDRVGIARVPTLLVTMQAMRQSVQAVRIANPWQAAAVQLITKTADVSLSCLTSTLAEARSMAESVPDLLKSWLIDPVGIGTSLSRADWLTDGWKWLCQLWSMAADPAAQMRALDEIVLIVPIIPNEVASWVGYGTNTVLPPRVARRPFGDDSDGLSLLDAIMRNETLLALAA